MPNVTRSDSSSGCPRVRLRTTDWRLYPSGTRSANEIGRVSSGSTCQSVKSQYVANAPSMTSSPCAAFRIPLTPKISERPTAAAAYTPPCKTPLMSVWARSTRATTRHAAR